MHPSTISRYEVTCAICFATIDPGDRMFCFVPPTEHANDGPDLNNFDKTQTTSLAWGHTTCYHSNLPPPPPCRHWKRLGRCPARQADMCAFRHDVADRGISSSLEKTRWGGKRHFVRNQHKNSVFRIFLMQMYGMEYMTQKSGMIIDAAGGKGELAWELLNLTGVKDCVVIDPRPMNLELVRSKWKKGIFEPKRTGPVFSKWYPACEEGCKFRESKSPSHVRCFFDSKAFLGFIKCPNEKSEGEKYNAAEQWLKEEIVRARRIVWTTKGLQHEDGSKYNEEIVPNRSDPADTAKCIINVNSFEIESPSHVRDILQNCKLIIGFHPDQAAGDIAEFAIAQNIPYCIVPCCVYFDCFPKRKLQNGIAVKTYDQLVDWLCEKDPRARIATLDVEGKNKVVYTLPRDMIP
ncbi:hypothetical protein HJC23_012220 [Cyclotella cryptica]|uniref:C3H1-type domain-containing protein n=1 Tax=Cyclotella cryptica TaxID=29204 RepID=A0ABD3P6B3_9STRA|eukprot:CCRYP_017720-RA/>CCRYP_017720-RA protein AED:0.10 eAED:0.10 QI:0/-1/0/1/-1/1/1/0/405